LFLESSGHLSAAEFLAPLGEAFGFDQAWFIEPALNTNPHGCRLSLLYPQQTPNGAATSSPPVKELQRLLNAETHQTVSSWQIADESGEWTLLVASIPLIEGKLCLCRKGASSPWQLTDRIRLAETVDGAAPILEEVLIPIPSRGSQHHLNSLLRSSDLGILFVQHTCDQTLFSLANQHFYQFFGSPRTFVAGQPIQALVDQIIGNVYASEENHLLITELFQKGSERNGELMVVQPQLRYLKVSSAPDFLDGQEIGRVILFRDVTRDKDLEQQLLHSQKMESIGTLAGGVAHDFNNLLTTMLGYAELVKRDLSSNDPNYPRVEQIEKSAKRAAELTNNLLAFSRRTPTQLSVIDASHLVRETTGLIRLSVPSSIQLRLNLANDLPYIEADETQLQQVLINLIINARDALPEERGEIVVHTGLGYDRAAGETDKTPYVLIEVEDNGTGIAKDQLSRIFEPFYTTKEVGKGTGLGLSMVYGIVKQHKGFIEVTSAPGEGSRFSVFLPPTTKNPSPPKNASDPPPIRPVFSKARLLVVDDEPDLLDFCEAALKDHCQSITCAKDGMEAVALFKANPDAYDLVLLDLTMPRMGGVECFHHLRNIRKDLRVIVSSGYSIEGAPGDLLRHGALAFLHKPYSVESLVSTIREHLALVVR
ncbi:MAG: ATP-binding protein, partial [Verrucomicrobiia bacterium]